jgi:hypothetical protein
MECNRVGRRWAIAVAAVAVGALGAWAPAAGAAPNVDLLTAANLRVDGAAANDGVAFSVAGAGDVNGDGRADVIVGAPEAGDNGRALSGSAYVLFGQATPTAVDLATFTGTQTTGFRIDGAAANDEAGFSVAGAGDVNGDGRADVIVGDLAAGNNGRVGSGSAYVVFGRTATTTIDLLTFTGAQTTGFRIDGAAAGDEAGLSVAGAGDVNGDGRADVVLGAPRAANNARAGSGSAYVVFGRTATTTIDLLTFTGAQTTGFRIDGAAAMDGAGVSVGGTGDVNGDGRPDVIVGAAGAGNNARAGSGSAYVVFGHSAGSAVDLAGFNGTQATGFRIDGAATNDLAGGAVAGAGDVNGDGRPDVIVGAGAADNNGRTNAGSAYVVFGRAVATTIDLAGFDGTQTTGFRIDGAAAGDAAGISVAGAGDVNGDARADVIVGAIGADNNGRAESGSAYVVLGRAAGPTIDLLGFDGTQTTGTRIDGAAAGDGAGRSVAGGADLNGDGAPDVIVGAPAAGNNGRANSGSAFVSFSPPPVRPVVAPPAPAPAAIAAPVTLRALVAIRAQRLATALRRGLVVRVSCSTACAVQGQARLDAAVRRRLRLGAISATGAATLRRAGTVAVRLRFTAATRRALRRSRRVVLTVRVDATAPGQRPTTLRRRIVLRR